MIYPREATQLREQDLITTARSGCLESFERLVEQYHGRILGYLTRQLGDREVAADLTQETFLDAFRLLDRLPDDRPFGAWLYRIARNHLLHVWRRRLDRILSLDWLLAAGHADQEKFCNMGQVDRCIECDVIQRVLNTLSPALREALLLSTLWGFPSQEVAQILAISPAAARQRIARAKEAFYRAYRLESGDINVSSESHPT
jgi:RNA polymerase sigma-70 factor (ECF subfamily)